MKDFVTIKGNDYKVKSTLRAIMMYEYMTEEAFKITTLTDTILFYYCLLKVNNTDTFNYDPQELIDIFDEEPALLGKIEQILKTQAAADSYFPKDDKTGKKKSKG